MPFIKIINDKVRNQFSLKTFIFIMPKQNKTNNEFFLIYRTSFACTLQRILTPENILNGKISVYIVLKVTAC